jgi:hypothetical protein
MAFMTVLNALARVIGWSPIGKPVLLIIDDSSEQVLNGCQFGGKLAALNRDGTALIELEMPLYIEGKYTSRVLAVPRHQGYGFDYLCWGFIAVNLANPDEVYGSTTQKVDNWFAVASMKIIKSAQTL